MVRSVAVDPSDRTPPAPSRNLFLASSPRHLLLAAGLALEAGPESSSVLLFIEHVRAEAVTRYLELVGGWTSSPFGRLERLRADWRPELGEGAFRGFRKRACKRRFRDENRRTLDALVEEVRPTHVYVGCDNYYESQYLLRRAKAADPGVRGALLEDGTAVYDYDFRRRPLRRQRDLVRRLSYGSWWRPCPIIGTSGWLDEAWVAFPELVLEELRGLDLFQLPAATFRGPAFRELAAAAGERFGVDLDAIRRASLVVVLTRSMVAARIPGYADTVVALVESFLEAGETVAVKYHPRETDKGFVPLAGRSGVHEIAGELLFEFVVALVESDELTVVGDVSTALLATRWLHPGVRLFALRHGTDGPGSDYLAKPFRALDIPVESDPRRIRAAYF